MKLFVAHASDFDFRAKLYEPLRQSPLNAEHEIILPQETGREAMTRELIAGCDALIIDVSRPSTGAGIEAGWASAAGVPIIAVYEIGSTVSNAITYVTPQVLSYESPADLVAKLTTALSALPRPH